MIFGNNCFTSLIKYPRASMFMFKENIKNHQNNIMFNKETENRLSNND